MLVLDVGVPCKASQISPALSSCGLHGNHVSRVMGAAFGVSCEVTADAELQGALCRRGACSLHDSPKSKWDAVDEKATDLL